MEPSVTNRTKFIAVSRSDGTQTPTEQVSAQQLHPLNGQTDCQRLQLLHQAFLSGVHRKWNHSEGREVLQEAQSPHQHSVYIAICRIVNCHL